MKKYLKGFTLVELLVVVTIIGVLSTLTVVYLEAARMSARDARRLSDVKQIQLALKMYYNDLGTYPATVTAGASIANGSTNYLLRIPTNPKPYIDNECPEEDYQYRQLEGGQRYSLSFCLGTKIDDLDPGKHSATHSGILNCPEGYVAVPGSSEFDTNDFCVMKYEAKCAKKIDLTTGLTGTPTVNNTYDNDSGSMSDGGKCIAANYKQTVSVATGLPIANVSATDAISYCEAIGAHLITNQEWMTIARNAETVASSDKNYSNWEGGAKGSGFMPLGLKNGVSAEAISEYPIHYLPPYEVQQRRTLTISTGEKIWDFSGSVSEWVSGTCSQIEYSNSGGYIDWTDASLNDYERAAAGPSSNTWDNTTNGIGQYFGCNEDAKPFLRGGNAGTEDLSGIYNLRLDKTVDIISPLWGFRCVK